MNMALKACTRDESRAGSRAASICASRGFGFPRIFSEWRQANYHITYIIESSRFSTRNFPAASPRIFPKKWGVTNTWFFIEQEKVMRILN